MKSTKALMVVMLAPLLLFSALVGLTQGASFSEREQNFREYVTLLRADVKAERKGIITQMMQFDADDAAASWPIFQQYDAELTKISDGRVQLIVDYARNYENLSDDQASNNGSKLGSAQGHGDGAGRDATLGPDDRYGGFQQERCRIAIHNES
jgi:hypothetical protein